MKLWQKMMLAPAVAVAMMVMMGIGAYMALQHQHNVMHRVVSEELARQTELLTIRGEIAHSHARAYRIISWINSVGQAQANSELDAVRARLEAMRMRLNKLGLQSAAKGTDAAAVTDSLAKYKKSVDDAVDLASVDAATGAAAMQTSDQAYQDLAKQLDALVDRESKSAHEQMAQADASAAVTLGMIAVMCLMAVCATTWVALWGTRRMTASVRQAVQAAQAIARGDLTVRLSSEGHDEIAELLRALRTMTDSLEKTVGHVQFAADTIRIASQEISIGNTDLSQRTEQQASSLQLTASSMQQLTETVNQNTEASRQASAMADSASEVARRGGEVVEQVVSTMDEIHQSSSKIADITNVIDGIAFQTNILALNAAVEAARAGEQGRGFAVVASEVRALAQRSADAAREIKSLIQTSVQRVSSGSQLVGDAGRTMKDIVSSVERVTHIMAEISSATEEQAKGLRQINQAVNQLDTMTQQNAAMVEQSAAAAGSLTTQAQSLAAVINTFRVSIRDERASCAEPAVVD